MVHSNNVFLALTIFITLFNNVTCLFFQTTTLAGFEIDINIGATDTTITARVDTSQQSNWHGIGFGGTQMRWTYAIIEEFGIPPTFSVRELGKSTGGGANPTGTEADATASNWIQNFDAASNPIIITLTRANDVGAPYYVFDPVATTLDIIYAYGNDIQPFLSSSGHTPGTRIIETLNDVTGAPTTSTPTTASPTTVSPTTTSPTTATPTTTTPTTTAPTTTTPTTATPTTTPPTTVTPTSASNPNGNTSFPTTSAPTTPQSTIAYTTDIPTTTTPTTASPTYTPTTASPTSTPTTTMPTTAAPSSDEYPAGVNGYIERGEDWINGQASQMQLLLICGGFAVVLVCCLCCFYFVQCRKTQKLKKTLFSFQPDLLQEEREKEKKQKGKNYDDIPFVDAVDPESSVGLHHNGDFVAPASAANDHVLVEEPPDDEEANFRKPNPNHNNRIPEEVENKLEESLSVESDPDKVLDMFAGGGGDVGDVGPVAPPPPSEPIPEDILQAHRARSVTQMQQKQNESIDRRFTYHPGDKQNNHKSELELQSMPLYGGTGLERVRTQSQIEADDDPPTPVSDEHDMLMEDKYHKHQKDNSLNVGGGSAKVLPLASKRNNNDPALALLSDEAIISSSPPQKAKINVNINNQENDKANENGNENAFDALSSPSSRMLFADKDENIDENIDAEKDPFSSIEAAFNALSNQMDDAKDEPQKGKPKAEQSGNDLILGMFDSDKYDSQPQPQPQPQPQQSPKNIGNAIVLDMFSAEPEPEPEPQPAPPAPQSEAQAPPQHRGKQVEDDPFASLDMSPTDLFAVNAPDISQKEAPAAAVEKKEKDSEAMGILGGLMSANPEFGDNDNIFGGGAGTQSVDAIMNATGPTSHIVDFGKYANVAATVPIDYDALTKISDTDQYKVVSVQETVVVDDGDGNIQESINNIKPIQENNDLRELDDILQDNMADASSDNVQVIAQDLNNNNNNNNDYDYDPFSPLNNAYDPFAALNASSPLDNMMNESVANNEGNEKKQAEIDPFDALNVTSPLDDIMNVSTNKENSEKKAAEENDPFAALTSSPLDNIMNQSNNNDEKPEENDPFAALNVSSPLDDIMNQSTDHNNNNNNYNNEAAFNQLSSPLDNIMNESTDNNEDEAVGFNQLSSPLDNIMTTAVISSSVSSDQSETPLVSPDNIGNLMKPNQMGHQTIDLDSFMQASDNIDSIQPVMYNEEIKEDVEEDDEDEEEESMGSEIIHDSPRRSEIVHEPLNPEIFGKEDGDDSSSESDEYTDDTDPNGY